MNSQYLKSILDIHNNISFEIIAHSSFNISLIQELSKEFGYKLFYLNGEELKNKKDLFTTFALVLEFPEYFGNNWDALTDCLRDLEWLPTYKGYILIYKNPELFAWNAPSDFETFLEIVNTVSKYWSDQKIKFLLILNSDDLNNLSNKMDHS